MDSKEIYQQFQMLLLIFVRVSCFISFAPLYGGKKVPKMSKITLAACISIFTYFSLPLTNISDFTTLDYAIYILKEGLTGLALGYSIYLVMSALFLAGHLIDFNLGFSMVNVFDPVAQIQVPLVGNFYYLLLITVMLITNADLYFIKSMVLSFEALPVGSAVISQGLVTAVIEGFVMVFVIAVKIASPVLVSVFILNIALGILVRAVPQMNMFVVGLPIKLLVGIFILLLTSPSIVKMADFMFTVMDDLFINMIRGLIG